MARPKTIHNPKNLAVKNAQIAQLEKTLAKDNSQDLPVETPVSTFFSSGLTQSVLSIHTDVDVSEDLKAEPTKTIAELLDDNIIGVSQKSKQSPKKSPKNKTKEVTHEEKEEIKEIKDIKDIQDAQYNNQNNQENKTPQDSQDAP